MGAQVLTDAELIAEQRVCLKMIEATVHRAMTVGMYSGGAASHVACSLVKCDRLLFADTGEESPSLYEAIEIGAKALGVPLVRVAVVGGFDAIIDGNRAIPSSRLPFCSRDLKIGPCNRWISENAVGATVVIGYTWDEINRIPATRRNYEKMGCTAAFPLADPPYLSREAIHARYKADVPVPQPLYEANLPHNNCGGACVKSGITQWTWVYHNDRARFEVWEERERRITDLHGKVCSVLKRFGVPYPLSRLRSDIESQVSLPLDEWGGCGCFQDGIAAQESKL